MFTACKRLYALIGAGFFSSKSGSKIRAKEKGGTDTGGRQKNSPRGNPLGAWVKYGFPTKVFGNNFVPIRCQLESGLIPMNQTQANQAAPTVGLNRRKARLPGQTIRFPKQFTLRWPGSFFFRYPAA